MSVDIQGQVLREDLDRTLKKRHQFSTGSAQLWKTCSDEAGAAAHNSCLA
jgi:hypothetical protein